MHMPVLKKRKKSGADLSPRLDQDAWMRAGREALIAGGISAVKVEPLAISLKVTTGSFYWHFRDRTALLDALIEDWEGSNSAGLFEAVAEHPGDADAQFDALANVWIEESNYSPAWDAAVRDWARIDERAESAVRRVDDCRIELWRGVFQLMGYKKPEDFVRARITYFHQVGYYAMDIKENRQDRLALKPVYLAVLKGTTKQR